MVEQNTPEKYTDRKCTITRNTCGRHYTTTRENKGQPTVLSTGNIPDETLLFPLQCADRASGSMYPGRKEIPSSEPTSGKYPLLGSTRTGYPVLGQGRIAPTQFRTPHRLSSAPYLYGGTSGMGRHRPHHSPSRTYLHGKDLGERIPPMDVGGSCPMVGTDGTMRQRLGSDAHQHPSRDGEIDLLSSARAGIIGELLYGQLRPDRPSELRTEAFALRPHQPGRVRQTLASQASAFEEPDADDRPALSQGASCPVQPFAPYGLVHRHLQPSRPAERPDGKPTLSLHRGGEEDREHALGAQAALRPTDGGACQWRALLVHRRGRKGTDEAQRAVLHPATDARCILPMLPSAGERRGTPVVHLVLHLLHPLEAFPQGDARDERPPVRQDIDAHRCGASAYGAGECVSGGGGGLKAKTVIVIP